MAADQGSNYSSLSVVFAFLGGAVAGVLGGLLLAPKSGEESPPLGKGYARRAEEEADDLVRRMKNRTLAEQSREQRDKDSGEAREGRVALEEGIVRPGG